MVNKDFKEVLEVTHAG